MYFVPAQANCRDNVGCCVRFREHVLDFKAGINVPLRHIVFLHRLDMFFGQQLMRLTLSHDFHDFKGHGRVQTMINQIEHDTVSGTDNLTDGAGSALNQVLRVAKPYIGSVRQTGNLQQIRKVFRLTVKQHLANKRGSHLRNCKRSGFTLNFFRSNTQNLR